MYKNTSEPLFMLILTLGTFITISSTSWLGAWAGLEINLLAFIPLMTPSPAPNQMSSEASLKYFLVQALASASLIFIVSLSMIKLNLKDPNSFNHLTLNSLIILTLMIKSGTAPFHFWFPGVMEGLSWINSLILMTWQKVAPLMLISYLIINSLMIMIILASVLIGSLGGMNQTSLRKLLAFSSISHIGWMIAAMINSDNLWLSYLVLYSLISSTLVVIFSAMKSFHLTQLFTLQFNSPTMKFCLFMSLLSLGGLPPFLGFLPKWLVIQSLTMKGQMILLMFMIICSLITLLFYLRVTFSAFMMNYPPVTWNPLLNMKKMNSFMLTSSMLTLTGLPLISFTTMWP